MNDEVLVLRTCAADGTSYDGFRWPLTVGAEVVAPDWSPVAECGRGLHGALHGEGDGGLFRWETVAVWMVVAVESDLVIDLGGKVKFPACVIRFVGDRNGATDYIMAHDPLARCVIGASVTAGDWGHATAGCWGHATAGVMGLLQIKWHDGRRYRLAVGYVGEDGIEPNVAYRCDDNGKLVRA